MVSSPVQPMQPNYVLMKLPGGAEEEFVQILPFTPANRNNLIGWIAGRSDGEAYGTIAVYNFPKTRLIDGPQQIEARIDQNAQLSGQLTLWNQQGSHVLRGSLLVIPTGRALLYAEPSICRRSRAQCRNCASWFLLFRTSSPTERPSRLRFPALFVREASSLTASETPQQAQSSASAPPMMLPQTNPSSSLLTPDLKDPLSLTQTETSRTISD